MPRALWPLHGPNLGTSNNLGVPPFLFGRVPPSAQEPAPIPVPRPLPIPLLLKGPGKLRARFPWPGMASPWLDPVPAPVAPILPPPIFVRIGSKAFGRRFNRALFASKVPTKLLISGVTRDSAGTILGGCTVRLFKTADNAFVDSVTSDATTGAYSFTTAGLSEAYYVVAYKAGSPDVAGTSLNTLIGV